LRITNIFDAVREGTYDDVKKFYNGNINIIDEYTGLNLLQQDVFGKSCIDYANEYSWRTDFIKIVEEFRNADK